MPHPSKRTNQLPQGSQVLTSVVTTTSLFDESLARTTSSLPSPPTPSFSQVDPHRPPLSHSTPQSPVFVPLDPHFVPYNPSATRDSVISPLSPTSISLSSNPLPTNLSPSPSPSTLFPSPSSGIKVQVDEDPVVLKCRRLSSWRDYVPEKEDICCICLEEYLSSPTLKPIQLPCSHHFCTSCIVQWYLVSLRSC